MNNTPLNMVDQSMANRLASSSSERDLLDKSDSKLPFPYKLHQLLEEADENGYSSIVSWLPSGKAFKIHDPTLFADTIMTKYFKQTKFKSFTRQLYIYGFTKIASGPSTGGFFHPEFNRDNHKECMSLTRRDSREDRRCKKNRPKAIDEENKDGNLRHVKLPMSLMRALPNSSAEEESDTMPPRPKKALSLFDQTFGSELDSAWNPPLGRVTGMVANSTAEAWSNPGANAPVGDSTEQGMWDLEPRPIEAMLGTKPSSTTTDGSDSRPPV